MGVLKDVSIKVGDFYMPIDFVILDMAEDSYTQIILDRPFLATSGYKIDVKEGKLTFDVGEHHAEFGLFKDFKPSPSIHSCCGCEVLDSNGLVSILDITLMTLPVLIVLYLRVLDLMVLQWILCHLVLLRTGPVLLMRVM